MVILLVLIGAFLIWLLIRSSHSQKNGSNPMQESSSPSKDDETMKRDILANMEAGKRYTIGDMLMSFDCFEPATSPARVSALLSKLGAKGTGEIVRTEENGKAYFSLAAESKSEKQLTSQQQKDEDMMRAILANMEAGKRYTIGDMLTTFDCFDAETTPQYISKLLSRLGAKGTGEIIRSEERGKAYFSLAGDEVNNTQNLQGTVLKMSPSIGQSDTSTETGQYKLYSEQSRPYTAPYHPTTPSWEEPHRHDEKMSNGKPTVYLDEISLRRDLQNYLGTAAYSGFPMAGMDVMRMRSMDTKEVMALADHMGFDLNKYIMDIRYE